MSDNTPTGIPAEEPVSPSSESAPRPPVPEQPAHTAATAAPAYSAQQPYTAPRVPTYAEALAQHRAAQSGGAQPTTGQPTAGQPTAAQPTAPYATNPYGSYGAAPQGQSSFGAAASNPTPAKEETPANGKIGAGKVVGLLVAAALVSGAAGLGGAAAGASLFSQGQSVVTTGPSTVTVNNTDSVNQTTAIAAKVVPSVVTISASSGSSGGTGSGVVLTKDGYVVTNTHVVTLDGATGDASLTVTTSDGKVYPAKIVGTDPTYDLAVIKLTGANDLTPIEFGDSTKLNVGDQTVAVGAPLGLSNTVTTGIVSALNRSIQIASSAAPEGDEQEQSPDGENDSPFQFDFGQGSQRGASSSISIAVVQTDAAINPGNSGGALVDGEGKLIGINVAIASTGETSASGQSGSIGVGFSIPSTIVKRISDELIADGKATHGLLGAMVGNAAAQKDATTAGAYISDVTSGGAAAAAGLKKGDVVTSFNGFPITDATDLTAQVRALAAGSEATIVYERGGTSVSADVTLGTLE